MNNWKEFKLGELIGINEKNIGKNSNLKFIEYIDTSSVTENIFSEPIYINIENAPSRAKRLVSDGDTIISTVRPIQKHYGYIKNAKENQVVSTGFVVVTPKRINSKFLYYFLTQEEITNYLNVIAEGGTTTFPAFKPDEINELIIKLPDLATQQEIAEVLSSIDDKIENNNKINKELEELAQTLFKQWFVDFEFPNEQGNPYKSSGGEMVDSELGEIPKGWEVGSFGDLCKIINGFAFKSKDFSDTGNNGIIKIKNVNGSVVDIINTQFVSSEVISSVQDKFRVLPGQILIAMTGAEVGKVGIVPKTNKSIWLNQRVGRFEPLIEENIVYIYNMFNTLNFTQVVRNSAMGSAQPNISAAGIESINCIIPPKDIMLQYSSINRESFMLKLNYLGENQELINLRDTLLPKLINGDLKLNELD